MSNYITNNYRRSMRGTTKNTRTKQYILYEGPDGISPKTIAYIRGNGVEYRVAALSLKQAMGYARRNVWVNEDDAKLEGILSVYRRGSGHELWCGCETHDWYPPENLAGVKAMREAMGGHACEKQADDE